MAEQSFRADSRMSCLRSSQHNSAPKERYNLAHGVSRGDAEQNSVPAPILRDILQMWHFLGL